MALSITGLVANEMAWSDAEVKAMETVTVQSTNKDGVMSDYTGVSLNALLALAGVSADATGLVFVADDGFTAEVTLAEIQACTDCIVSFRSQWRFQHRPARLPEQRAGQRCGRDPGSIRSLAAPVGAGWLGRITLPTALAPQAGKICIPGLSTVNVRVYSYFSRMTHDRIYRHG